MISWTLRGLGQILILEYHQRYLILNMLNSPLPIPGILNHHQYQKNSIFCVVFIFCHSLNVMFFFKIWLSNTYNLRQFYSYETSYSFNMIPFSVQMYSSGANSFPSKWSPLLFTATYTSWKIANYCIFSRISFVGFHLWK